MIKMFVNPRKFNRISDIIFKPLLFISVATLILGLIFAFFLSPEDYQQGSTVRIMYIHVPSAWLALLTFLIMTIYSIIALAFKIPFGFIIAWVLKLHGNCAIRRKVSFLHGEWFFYCMICKPCKKRTVSLSARFYFYANVNFLTIEFWKQEKKFTVLSLLRVIWFCVSNLIVY